MKFDEQKHDIHRYAHIVFRMPICPYYSGKVASTKRSLQGDQFRS